MDKKSTALLVFELIGACAFAYAVWDGRHDRAAWIIAVFSGAVLLTFVVPIRWYLRHRLRDDLAYNLNRRGPNVGFVSRRR